MRAILDDVPYWFIHAVNYQGWLRIILVEGRRSDESQLLHFHAASIDDLHSIEICESSRLLSVRFPETIAWQVVDERYTVFDEYEQCDDDHTLRVYSRSRYLDYVNQHHGLFQHLVGPARHYRLWSPDEVIDVVSCEEPVVEPWHPAGDGNAHADP